MNQAQESSPSEHWWVKVRLEELEARFNRLQFQTEGRFQRLETRVAEMQEMILGVEQRLGDLEPGPPSQPAKGPSAGRAIWQVALGPQPMLCPSCGASLMAILELSRMVTTDSSRSMPSTPGESEGT